MPATRLFLMALSQTQTGQPVTIGAALEFNGGGFDGFTGAILGVEAKTGNAGRAAVPGFYQRRRRTHIDGHE